MDARKERVSWMWEETEKEIYTDMSVILELDGKGL